MWEDPIVKEVHEIRKQLAAKDNFDIKAMFADLYRRQEALGDRLVSPGKRAESEAQADPGGQPHSEAVKPSEAAPAA